MKGLIRPRLPRPIGSLAGMAAFGQHFGRMRRWMLGLGTVSLVLLAVTQCGTVHGTAAEAPQVQARSKALAPPEPRLGVSREASNADSPGASRVDFLGNTDVAEPKATSAPALLASTRAGATLPVDGPDDEADIQASEGTAETGLSGRTLALASPGTMTLPSTPRQVLASFDAGPEGRLLAAYRALQVDGPRAALSLVKSLLDDHPGFSLAHLLHGDLLATLSGQPRAFGLEPDGEPPQGDRRFELREEARRRWAAAAWSPPTGRIPLEFLQLTDETRHAVAIDTSRSRLYLFEHGKTGLRLVRDLYISVGRLGVGKQVEGDQRTPLGLYWITSTFRAPMRDPRLGEAALGINYPNAWDRELGRTGRGLFLHGVPAHLLAHVPQATDGCVAMSNEDAVELLSTLDPVSTPVLIAPQLQWVTPSQAQSFHEGFRSAHAAWQAAMRQGDLQAARGWYDPKAAPVDWAEVGPPGEPSILGWYGDGRHVVVVTARHRRTDGDRASLVRQYWVKGDGGWRIFFDGLVPQRSDASSRPRQRRSASTAQAPRS